MDQRESLMLEQQQQYTQLVISGLLVLLLLMVDLLLGTPQTQVLVEDYWLELLERYNQMVQLHLLES